MRVHLTIKSGNAKTGPIPVSTTEKSSCPDNCSLKGQGCYAESGPLGIHWSMVSSGKRGTSWQEFCDSVRSFADNALWRHNQAGDLPSSDNINLDSDLVGDLVLANMGKRGFTYTHYPVLDNLHNQAIVRSANNNGFTINLSAESLTEVDQMVSLNIAPVVTILPEDAPKVQYTVQGNKVILCPATYNDDISCADCALCQKQGKRAVIGFPVHGSGKKKANKVFSIKSV
jgi:hypothetical protein